MALGSEQTIDGGDNSVINDRLGQEIYETFKKRGYKLSSDNYEGWKKTVLDDESNHQDIFHSLMNDGNENVVRYDTDYNDFRSQLTSGNPKKVTPEQNKLSVAQEEEPIPSNIVTPAQASESEVDPNLVAPAAPAAVSDVDKQTPSPLIAEDTLEDIEAADAASTPFNDLSQEQFEGRVAEEQYNNGIVPKEDIWVNPYSEFEIPLYGRTQQDEKLYYNQKQLFKDEKALKSAKLGLSALKAEVGHQDYTAREELQDRIDELEIKVNEGVEQRYEYEKLSITKQRDALRKAITEVETPEEAKAVLDDIEFLQKQMAKVHFEEQSRKGSISGAVQNSLVEGVIKTTESTSKFVLGAMAYFEPKLLGITQEDIDAGTAPDAKERVQIAMDTVDKLGLREANEMLWKDAETTEEYINKLKSSNLFWGGTLGLAESAYPMMSYKMTGFFLNSFVDSYQEMEKANPDATVEELAAYGTAKGLVVYGAERLGFKALKGNKALTTDVTRKIFKKAKELDGVINKNSINKAISQNLKGFLAEAESGALEFVGDDAISEIYNAIKGEEFAQTTDGFKEYWSSLFNSAVMEGIGGSIMKGGGQAWRRIKNGKSVDPQSTDALDVLSKDSDESLKLIQEDLNLKIERGEISTEQADKQLTEMTNILDMYGWIPEDLSSKTKGRVLTLVKQKQDLLDRRAKGGDTFANKLNETIASVQEEIDLLVSNDTKSEEQTETEVKEPTLKKNNSPTDEDYGTINRNDDKGLIPLSKTEYEEEVKKLKGTEIKETTEKIVDETNKVTEKITTPEVGTPIAEETKAAETKTPEATTSPVAETKEVKAVKGKFDELLEEEAKPTKGEGKRKRAISDTRKTTGRKIAEALLGKKPKKDKITAEEANTLTEELGLDPIKGDKDGNVTVGKLAGEIAKGKVTSEQLTGALGKLDPAVVAETAAKKEAAAFQEQRKKADEISNNLETMLTEADNLTKEGKIKEANNIIAKVNEEVGQLETLNPSKFKSITSTSATRKSNLDAKVKSEAEAKAKPAPKKTDEVSELTTEDIAKVEEDITEAPESELNDEIVQARNNTKGKKPRESSIDNMLKSLRQSLQVADLDVASAERAYKSWKIKKGGFYKTFGTGASPKSELLDIRNAMSNKIQEIFSEQGYQFEDGQLTLTEDGAKRRKDLATATFKERKAINESKQGKGKFTGKFARENGLSEDGTGTDLEVGQTVTIKKDLKDGKQVLVPAGTTVTVLRANHGKKGSTYFFLEGDVDIDAYLKEVGEAEAKAAEAKKEARKSNVRNSASKKSEASKNVKSNKQNKESKDKLVSEKDESGTETNKSERTVAKDNLNRRFDEEQQEKILGELGIVEEITDEKTFADILDESGFLNKDTIDNTIEKLDSFEKAEAAAIEEITEDVLEVADEVIDDTQDVLNEIDEMISETSREILENEHEVSDIDRARAEEIADKLIEANHPWAESIKGFKGKIENLFDMMNDSSGLQDGNTNLKKLRNRFKSDFSGKGQNKSNVMATTGVDPEIRKLATELSNILSSNQAKVMDAKNRGRLDELLDLRELALAGKDVDDGFALMLKGVRESRKSSMIFAGGMTGTFDVVRGAAKILKGTTLLGIYKSKPLTTRLLNKYGSWRGIRRAIHDIVSGNFLGNVGFHTTNLLGNLVDVIADRLVVKPTIEVRDAIKKRIKNSLKDTALGKAMEAKAKQYKAGTTSFDEINIDRYVGEMQGVVDSATSVDNIIEQLHDIRIDYQNQSQSGLEHEVDDAAEISFMINGLIKQIEARDSKNFNAIKALIRAEANIKTTSYNRAGTLGLKSLHKQQLSNYGKGKLKNLITGFLGDVRGEQAQTNAIAQRMKDELSLEERIALTFIRETGNAPVNRRYNFKDDAQRRKVNNLIAKPTDSMNDFRKELNGFYKEAVLHLQSEGMLAAQDFHEEYTPNAYEIVPFDTKQQGSSGVHIKGTDHSKMKNMENYNEAIGKGFTPKTLDAAEILVNYSNTIYNQIGHKNFSTALLEMTDGNGRPYALPSGSKGIPTDWVEIKKGGFKSKVVKNGEVMYKGIHVNPEVYNVIKGLVGTKSFGIHNDLTTLEKINNLQKRNNLMMSFFHHVALTETALGTPDVFRQAIKMGGNPLKLFQKHKANDYLAMRDVPLAKEAIASGLSIEAAPDFSREAVESMLDRFEEWTTKQGSKLVGDKLGQMNPVKGMNKAARQMDRFLWDYMHNNYKLVAYQTLVSKAYEKLDTDSLSDANAESLMKKARQEVAQHVNDTFGGQSWELLMQSPKTIRIAQMMLLSPDWTISTARQAFSVFSGIKHSSTFRRLKVDGEKGSPVSSTIAKLSGIDPSVHKETAALKRQMGFKFFARIGQMYYGTMNVLNYALTSWMADEDDERDFMERGNFMWDNETGHKLHLFIGKGVDGRNRYVRLGKQMMEVPEMMENPLGRLTSKFAPIIQSAYVATTGASPSGYRKFEQEEGGWENIGKGAFYLGLGTMPFSLQGIAEAMVNNGYYKNQRGVDNFIGFMFPVSKGISSSGFTKGFKQATKDGDFQMMTELWYAAHINNVAVNSNFINSSFKSIMKDVEKEITKNSDVNSPVDWGDKEKDLYIEAAKETSAVYEQFSEEFMKESNLRRLKIPTTGAALGTTSQYRGGKVDLDKRDKLKAERE